MATTFLTIQQRVAQQTRLNLGQGVEQALIKGWINEVGQDIHNRNDWQWARERAIVQTVLDKTAGTIAVSSGGTTITGTTTAFAAGDVGKFIQTSASDDWYKITSVDGSAQTLVIEAAFTGTANLTAGTYTIRQWLYSLPSTAEKPLTIRQSVSPRQLTPVRFREFDEIKPDPTSTGKAKAYFLWGVDSSGNIQFTVWPWPDSVYNLEVRFKKRYVELSGDTDTPALPEAWRYVITEGALAKGFRHVANDPQDTRAVTAAGFFEGKIELMKQQADPGDLDYAPVLQNREVASGLSLPRLPDDFDIR